MFLPAILYLSGYIKIPSVLLELTNASNILLLMHTMAVSCYALVLNK